MFTRWLCLLRLHLWIHADLMTFPQTRAVSSKDTVILSLPGDAVQMKSIVISQQYLQETRIFGQFSIYT